MPSQTENPNFRTKNRYNIDISNDLTKHPNWTFSWAKLDDKGSTEQHYSDTGADYTYAQIDYKEGDEIRANRTIAIITPGNRTELAYWTKAAPSMTLNIHQGKGELIIGDPNNQQTHHIPIDNSVNKTAQLPAGYFYTIQAAKDCPEKMIVSSLHCPPPDWEKDEVSILPGQEDVETSEGTIHVPDDFRELFLIPGI